MMETLAPRSVYDNDELGMTARLPLVSGVIFGGGMGLATLAGELGGGGPVTARVLRALVVAFGPHGERVIPIDDFFTGLFATALAGDEILVEVRVPIPPPRSGGAYLKLERKVGDYATAAAAVQLTLAADGTVERAGIGLTAAGPVPVRAVEAEAFLVGRTPDAAAVAEAARLAGIEPPRVVFWVFTLTGALVGVLLAFLYPSHTAGFQPDDFDRVKRALISVRDTIWQSADDRGKVDFGSIAPVVREGWRIGLPQGGTWREVLNTDSRFYGGGDRGYVDYPRRTATSSTL